jgi:hypothetical protein
MTHHRFATAVLSTAALACGALTVFAVTPAHAEGDPLDDPQIQSTLRSMGDASTWYHPDLFGEYAGVRRYAHHDFAGAAKYFKIGAYYADKFSQLSLGLMYSNGEGVEKDPVAAYAWIDIAAERGYPDFVATRDRIKASLTPNQLEEAEAVRANLARTYADDVAKPRMERQLRMGRAQMTGSRAGFDFGVLHATMKQNCGVGASIGGVNVPVAGCGGADIYAPARWEPRQYFASRDAQWKATVTVGEMKQSADPPSASDPAGVP